MTYKELELDNLFEIDSVSSLISRIKKLRETNDGASTELFFRGQEVEFWDIQPSVFRNDMLSIEHKLMQIPLQRIPNEFKGFHTTFDIMTKYQHYGMCTRLLDLTLNPLVALYFSCKIHGDELYESDGEQKAKEPYGVIYYTNNYYPLQSNAKEVQIVSALASYDLSRDNTVSDILDNLVKDKIIDDKDQKRWLQNECFADFVNIIQNNYMVTPAYTNERLQKQSGVFLLAGLFSIEKGTNIGDSIITKTKGNLRNAFNDTFFYIRGENKESILRELDLYNINEATLFPELEHQLSYIKYIYREHARSVSSFAKYEGDGIINELKLSLDNDKLNKYIINKLSTMLKSTVDDEDIDEVKKIIQNSFVVDWYRRDDVLSRIKMEITGYYFVKNRNKNISKEKANSIVTLLNEIVKEFAALSSEDRSD